MKAIDDDWIGLRRRAQRDQRAAQPGQTVPVHPAGDGDRPHTTGARLMDGAKQALRDEADEYWTEVADGMLQAILASPRPSHPVRGQEGATFFHVREKVLTRHVLAAVDAISQVAVDVVRIRCDEDRYTGVAIVIRVRYGEPIIPLADRVRGAATRQLRAVLGKDVPTVAVLTMQVHAEDVTRGDPALA